MSAFAVSPRDLVIGSVARCSQRLGLLDEPAHVVTPEVLYAGDTVLVSSSASNLQHMLAVVVREGARYGLEFTWDRTVQMQISNPAHVARPDGECIKSVRKAVYLGGMLTCDRRVSGEVCCRDGGGLCTFESLSRAWSRLNLTRRRKLDIYVSTVVSKMLYSLDSL